MKFQMLSVIVGTEACVAQCPFCVSCERINEVTMNSPKINWRNFNIAANLANRSNVDTVMLTSRGEPTLFPDEITDYLKHLKPYKFPFIELQSNMIPVLKNKNKYSSYLKEWYDLGLTTITISVVSNEYEKNKSIYAPNGEYIDLVEGIQWLHSFGFSLRLTCVLCKGITHTVDDIRDFIYFAKQNKVEQVTLRPLNEEFRRESIKPWIKEHLLSEIEKQTIFQFLYRCGTLLLNLNRIGSVFDFDGQNVMYSLPLNMNTRDENPENGRNLIFFKDGHIHYEWEKTGGILL